MENKIKSIDDFKVKRLEENQFEFIMSTNDIDRHLERMEVAGIQLTNFKKNPIAFWNHSSWDYPIGKWLDIRVEANKLIGVLEFHGETDESKTLSKLTSLGYINAVSIGFRTLKQEQEPVPDYLKDKARDQWVDNILVHKETELYETSLVTIPANAEAVRIKSIVDFQNNKIGLKELNIIEESIKAGQVLSKKNKDKLREAVTNINDVLKSADSSEDEEEKINYEKIENYLITKFEV